MDGERYNVIRQKNPTAMVDAKDKFDRTRNMIDFCRPAPFGAKAGRRKNKNSYPFKLWSFRMGGGGAGGPLQQKEKK